jgi:hypothetical protein
MTNTINHAQVSIFAKELLTQKCSNYGYDYKGFKRVSSQRSKARKEFENFFYYNPATVLDRLQNESRVSLENCKIVEKLSNGSESVRMEMRLSYAVGQSQNEEITNLMRRLVNPKAKWVK